MKEQINVLLIDDEQDLLDIMSKRLTRRGYTVRIAQSCAEGFAALKTDPADVIVLDLMLPDRDGLDCLREIKSQYPSIAVILLTGHASMQTGLQSLKLGAHDYCLKPIGTDELAEKIEIAYRERTKK